MKNTKFNSIVDIALKICVLVILIVAVTTRQHYVFYTFVRWTLFSTSLYFAYKTRREGIISVIYFCAVAILFNPFKPFGFHREIWRIIDSVIALFTFLSIWFIIKKQGKLISNLIKKSFWGVLLLFVVVWIAVDSVGNPFHEYLLMTKGITTKGYITYAKEEESYDSDEGEPNTYYYYSYNFTTVNGKNFVSDATEDGEIPDELKNLTHPYPRNIVYLKDNPEINKPKEQVFDSLGDLIRNKVGKRLFLLILTPIGFYLIRDAIKEYLSERKTLTESIDIVKEGQKEEPTKPVSAKIQSLIDKLERAKIPSPEDQQRKEETKKELQEIIDRLSKISEDENVPPTNEDQQRKEDAKKKLEEGLDNLIKKWGVDKEIPPENEQG